MTPRAMDGNGWQEVTAAEPCPICEKPDWCRRSPDGTKIACRREARGAFKTKRYKDGSEAFLYVLCDASAPYNNGRPKRQRQPSGATLTAPNGPILQDSPTPSGDGQDAMTKRDTAYRCLLARLPLSPDHRNNLRQRGLSDADIYAGEYRTLPTHGRAAIAKTLAAELGQDFAAVPGFMMGERGLRIAAPAGLLVPVRDLAGRVVALKLKRDNPEDRTGKYRYLSSTKYGGPGPGSPAHVPAGITGTYPVVRIAEGELKADVAWRLSGVPTISFPGVASWRAVLAVLQELRAQTVRVAFDADAHTNPHVARALRDCYAGLRAAGFAVEVESWPIDVGKGIDDVLAAGRAAEIEILAGPAALAVAEEITAVGVHNAGGDEVDLADVVRPEIVVTLELTAIAIPRLVRTPRKVIGEWTHYIRHADGRREAAAMRPTITLASGRELHVLPMPDEPTASEVRDLARWSAAARTEWLAGTAAPTTSEVFASVAEHIGRYIELPPDTAAGTGATLTLWVMHTYIYRALAAVPYLHIVGPADSGKTRLADVLGRLAYRPISTSSMTAAALFRTRHAHGGTLILDEAERLRDTRDPTVCELRAMLLAGYRRGGQATRLEPAGNSYRAKSYDVFGPAVIACIANLPPALASRCITIRMMRAAAGSARARCPLDAEPTAWQRLRNELHAWGLETAGTVLALAAEPQSWPGLANRTAEVWTPLRLLARLAGIGDLLADHARAASESASEDTTPDADPLLIAALYRLLTAGEHPTAADVLSAAREQDPDHLPASEWTARRVSGVLRRYGIATRKTDGRKRYCIAVARIAEIAARYSYDIA